jgi:predicted DNA-binding transcriptional regulator AlpA
MTEPGDDVRAVAEALADVLAERGMVVAATLLPQARVLNAAEVASLLGRDRQWVYDHAGELGAFRYGNGPRARIGFDVATIEEWKRARQVRESTSEGPRRRRRPRSRGVQASSLIPYETPRETP